jgi:ElaB/YqjD/DUF883 family membrane-anchored ribosome-binding protein
MPASDAAAQTVTDAKKTVNGAKKTAADARRTVEEFESALPEIARRAERVFQEGVGHLKTQARDKLGVTSEHLDSARLYVVERVQERPFTTTLAALGAGFLIGLLFAGNRR